MRKRKVVEGLLIPGGEGMVFFLGKYRRGTIKYPIWYTCSSGGLYYFSQAKAIYKLQQKTTPCVRKE
jgi:hypothetical protein